MASSRKRFTAKKQRRERIWAVVLGGGFGGCLAAAALTQVPLLSGAPKSMPVGMQAGKDASLQVTSGNAIDDDEIRTGSIVVPVRRDDCEQRVFDNYTGQIWIVGRVSCEAALSRSKDNKAGPDRVQTISNAFRFGR